MAIEMFRDSGNISSPVMNDIFTQKYNSRYNWRQISKFLRPLVKLVNHGSEKVPFIGPKTWDMLLDDCKNIDNLNTFKKKFKTSKPENCPDRLSKTYMNSIDFVWRRKRKFEIVK